jgi:hypothetical protein
VQEYARSEPDTVTLINEFLTDTGQSLDGLTAAALGNIIHGNLDHIERIDRLTTIAEGRRNASLHEIDRRRAVLAATLRRNLQEIENSEYKVIETTPTGKNAH